MHAWFHSSVIGIERRNEKAVVRAHVDVCLYDLISSWRFALLHRLTRFLLLLSIIIVALHGALLHFLLKPSSSILTRFRFSPSSSSSSFSVSSSLGSFIHAFIEQNWNDNTVGNRMKRADIRRLEDNVCTSSTTLILVISFSFFSSSHSRSFACSLSPFTFALRANTFYSQVFAHLDLIS